MAAADDSVSCNDCSAIPTIIDPKLRSRFGAVNASRDAWNDAHANDAASADVTNDDARWFLSYGSVARTARFAGWRIRRWRTSEPVVKTNE